MASAADRLLLDGVKELCSCGDKSIENDMDSERDSLLHHILVDPEQQEGRLPSRTEADSAKGPAENADKAPAEKKDATSEDWQEFLNRFYKWTEDGIGLVISLSIFILAIIVSAAGQDLAGGYSATSEWAIGAIGIAIYVLFFSHYLLGTTKTYHIETYAVLLLIAVVARSLGNYYAFKESGLSASLWAILIGIACRFFGLDILSKASAQGKIYVGEYFVKIGVTLMAMDFTSVVVIGGPGLLVAWVDTLIVITIGVICCIKVMDLDVKDAIVISGATSICGSSAATALSAAIHPKGYTDTAAKTIIAIMGVLNAPLMPIMPLFKTLAGLSPVMVGAWIGGSIDSTGQVTASAEMGGSTVLKSAIIIKMAQNILIGPLCLVFTSYFQNSLKVSILISKFPPFVTGFLLTSLVATIFLNTSATTNYLQDKIISNSWCISEWLTLIGFVGIGLEINIREFFQQQRDKSQQNQMKQRILLIYLLIQTIDVMTTFGWSYLVFRNNNDNDDDGEEN